MIPLALALACSHPADLPDDTGTPVEQEEFAAPDQPGPYPVGTRAVELPGPDGLTLEVQIWYPATEAGDPYLYLGLTAGTASEDTPPDCSRARPVVAFSHGNGGINVQSVFFTEHLASHGYVVIAPNHTYNTLFDDTRSMLDDLVYRRPQDIEASFDGLLSLAEQGGDLAGCVDADAGYAMTGHSFGGYTTFATAGAAIDAAASAAWCDEQGGWLCNAVASHVSDFPEDAVADLGDDRVWAAIPMSPAGYEALVGGLADIAAPTMILSGTWDDLTPWDGMPLFFDGLQVTPRYLGGVEAAGHYTFSNACDFAPSSYDDCSGDYIPPEEAHVLINTLATAFLGAVRGLEGASDWLPPDSDALSWQAEE